MTLPRTYSTWQYKDVVEAFNAVIESTVGKVGYDANRKFVVEGDHWNNGANWPVAGNVSVELRSKILKAVEPQFTPVDAIGEVLDNVANGLLDQEAAIAFSPIEPAEDPESPEGEQQQAEMDAMLRFLSGWWDRVKFWDVCKQATRHSRWATRGAARVFVTPAKFVTQGDATGIPTDLTFQQALDAIQVMAPDPSSGMVFTHPETQQRAALFTYKAGDSSSPRNVAEIWFSDDGVKTTLRLVEEGASTAKTGAIEIGGALPIAQMTAPLLIKATVRRQQNRLNFCETVLVRLIETAGFRERYTTNAKPQGTWMRTAPTDGPPLEVAEDDAGGKWYLHPTPRTMGAAITTDLRGLETESTPGNKTLASPGITVVEPTDPASAITGASHSRYTILRECKQGHLANESTAETSGLAYIQARAVHEKDLNATRGPLEGMIRDVFGVVIPLAETMSSTKRNEADGIGEAPFLSRYRIVVNVHVNAGPATPEELTENRAQYKDGLLSKETAMARNRVEDTAAERSLIDRDPAALIDLRTKQATAVGAWVSATASFEGACALVGISEEDAKKLLKTDLTNSDVTQ